MQVYVDGSSLRRYLVDVPGAAEWRAWAATHETSFVTSPLGLMEFHRAADGLDAARRTRAFEVRETIAVRRFSDQAIRTAAMALTVLSPFGALHLGVASSDPEISTLATYDKLLARVAAIYGLTVVSPGSVDGWWER
ncbi:hypothetical protein EUA98_07585 [Pengzhenrongella frigida]|uniref:PIN domain-containing protein n=2 Tax=Pengzhenrongella frigida TaxID=1259133 RepID=A0A4Q5N631_9MICO|nr:hypothetical protein [Cellulomonas sp. HLT2-17]RYV51631.1 hypothetical protein EUA98_07585 [Cellulomonas sp. HLT2-17]